MSLLKKVDWVERGFQIVAGLNGLAVLVVLAVYSYGGWFSRYRADDYCHSVYLLTTSNFLDATIKAYNTWLGRYSIMSFVQLTDLIGIWGVRLMAGGVLLIWVTTLTWLISEIGKAVRVKLGFVISFWIAGLIIFISLYQTPALYQLLYWRATLPYTIPLGLFVGIAALIFWYARFPYQRLRFIEVGILGILLVFYAGGFGESTGAFQVGVLIVATIIMWLTRNSHKRPDLVFLLMVFLVSAIISILVIGLSPGTAIRLDAIMVRPTVSSPIELSWDVIVFMSQFLISTFKVSFMPNLVAIMVPMALIYFLPISGNEKNPLISVSRICLLLLIVPALMFFVAGCSFAPSVFVRTFPLARVRFTAHFVLTFCLVLEGGLLGILLKRIQTPIQAKLLSVFTLGVLAIFALYPLRASQKIYASLMPYRNFALAWDIRDAQIRQAVTEGVKDLVVVQLDSVGDVGEYKGFGAPNHWINICAADYYGLHTLVAP